MEKLAIIGIVFLLLSCSSNVKQEKEVYSEDGNLLKKYEYTDPKDTNSYVLTEYFKDGGIESIVPVYKGKTHGIVKVFYPNHKIWLIRRYEFGEYHGITYEFNKDLGYLQREILYLNSEQIIDAQYGRAIDSDTLFGVSYFYPIRSDNDTTFWPVGSITWNKKGKKIKNMLTYYEIEAKDTVKMGEPYKIDLNLHMGLYDDLSLELALGDFDNNFNFIDSSKVTKYTSDSLSLSFTVNDYEKGSNLLLGKIQLLKDGKDVTAKFLHHPQIKEYLFYHQFDAVE